MKEILLKKLGFNATETKIYLLLLELGKSTANILSKRLGIPRTTVYSALGNLVTKGIVSEEKESSVTFFIIQSVNSLERMIENEKRELKSKEDSMKALLPQLQSLFQSTQYHVPRIQYFEGNKNVENMLYDFSKTWQEEVMKTDKVWWGYQDHTFVESYMKWLQYYWEMKQPDEVVQLLSNASEVEKKLKGKIQNRDIRPVPSGYNFNSTIWVLGDCIVMIMTQQSPHYAFQIRDPLFAGNLRELFKMLWEKEN